MELTWGQQIIKQLHKKNSGSVGKRACVSLRYLSATTNWESMPLVCNEANFRLFFLDNFNNNLWWKTPEKIQTPMEFEPVPCTYYRYHWFAREFPTIFFPWLLFSFKKLILFIYGKFTDANDLTLAKQQTSFHLNEMRKSLKSPFLFFSVRKQLSS